MTRRYSQYFQKSQDAHTVALIELRPRGSSSVVAAHGFPHVTIRNDSLAHRREHTWLVAPHLAKSTEPLPQEEASHGNVATLRSCVELGWRSHICKCR